METVACNLCGGMQTRPFRRRQGMHVVQCVGCGLVYVSPRLDAAALDALYNGNGSSRISYYQDTELADRRSFAEMLTLAHGLLPGGRRLLDVGPNIGTCLDLARQRGYDVQGIELNAEAARHCREERGLDVKTGVLEEDTYPAATFDLVILADVIEHVPDPRGLLRIVARVVRPGGLVVISTPDISGRAARLLQVKPEEHIYYFSPATMTAALQAAGLEVVRMEPFDRYHNLTAMEHSTTGGGLLQALAPVFRLSRRVLGDLVVKLPLKENLLAVARRPAGASEVAS
jgi:2-polyprenyl-3-methyl-5-hydroxy-6-metoxy-1,4-benzoquinol methylase